MKMATQTLNQSAAKTLCTVYIAISGAFVVACASQSEGNPGADGDITKSSRVRCNDAANTILCWKETGCNTFDPGDSFNAAAEVCAAFFPNTNASDYPDAVFDGVCNSTEDAADGLLPCVCLWGGNPPVWGPENDQEPSCVENGEGGDTGEPTTGESPTTGDPEVEERWVCSPLAETNCQTRSGAGLGASDPACWQPDTDNVALSECVMATGYMAAVTACQCLCDNRDEQLTGECNTENICEVETHLDCVLTDLAEAPVRLSEYPNDFACSTEVNAAVACPANYKLFDATISVVLADGTSAVATGLVGYLDYSISGCADGTCAFEMPLLMLPHHDISGFYVQGTNTGTYSLENLYLQMESPLSGFYNQSRQTITFPTAGFTVSGNITNISLDSVAMPVLTSPGQRLPFSTSQVVGSSTITSPLSLNLTFPIPGGTVWASLTVR